MSESGDRQPAARRGAPLKPLHDRTALNGDQVDMSVRIAWLLRTCRLVSPLTRGLPQYAMVERLAHAGLSVSRNWVHRLETGELRSGVGAEAYEQALGLPPGRLRAAIDLVCRSIEGSPADSDPGILLDDVEELSAVTDAVLGDAPSGWDWFTWGRQFSRSDVRGLRVQVAGDLIDRLCGELCRAIDAAYDSRYEALAAVRSGPYGALVVERVRERVADPHAQSLVDLVSAVTEVADEEALDLCVELIADPRERVVRAAATGAENLLADGAAVLDWPRLAAAAVAAFNASEPGGSLELALTHVLRILAGRVPVPRPARVLPPAADVDVAGRAATKDQWRRSHALADDIAAEVGLPSDGLLARLLFEMLVGRSTGNAFASSRLLASVPFAGVIVDHVVRFVEAEPDPVLRARMLGRLPMLAGSVPPSRVDHWLADPELCPAGLVLLAHGGVRPDPVVLGRLLADPATRPRALYAAGMTEHPILSVLTDGREDEELAGAAAWWLEQGGRVVDSSASAAVEYAD